MYEDLADAVEHFKEIGFINTFELRDESILCRDLGAEFPVSELRIIESYRHERMTDPGTDETVFALESASGIKGILVAGYGKYVEQDKAHLIDKLLNTQDKTQ